MKWLLNLYLIIRNSIDFPLRRLIRWRRKGLEFHNEYKDALFADYKKPQQKKLQDLEAKLRNQYQLENFYRNSTKENYLENLYYLQMLEAGLETANLTIDGIFNLLDTGPSHWFYVQTLSAYLHKRLLPGQKFSMSSHEIDPYRVYSDYFSRMDHAAAHIRDLDNASFHPKGFVPDGKKYNLIISFFPFIFIDDHLKWGLPLWKFNPEKLLRNQIESLDKEGYLLISNEGKKEFDKQQEFLAELNIKPTMTVKFESAFYQYQQKRYLTLVKSNG